MAKNLSKKGIHIIAGCLTPEAKKELEGIANITPVLMDVVTNEEQVRGVFEKIKEQIGDKRRLQPSNLNRLSTVGCG